MFLLRLRKVKVYASEFTKLAHTHTHPQDATLCKFASILLDKKCDLISNSIFFFVGIKMIGFN